MTWRYGLARSAGPVSAWELLAGDVIDVDGLAVVVERVADRADHGVRFSGALVDWRSRDGASAGRMKVQGARRVTRLERGVFG